MKRIVLVSILLVAHTAVAPHVGAADNTSGVKTIAVIEMAQETNSFSPVPTTRADFAALSLYYGEEIIAVSKKEGKQLFSFTRASI